MTAIDTGTLQYMNRPIETPRAQGAAAGAKGGIDKSSKLYEQCREFESIFVKMMLTAMRKTVDKSEGLINGGMAEDIYQDMLNDEYAKSMTKTAGFGLADQVYLQLINGK
jgi:flagellar protein FlgJ